MLLRGCFALPDEHYINPGLAGLYDHFSPWSIDRDFYLSLAGSQPQTILDLGCGTGLICSEFAALGHNVTGVDPAAAMLNIARRKPLGAQIEWVEGNAQTFRSEKRFDLIIMTGHAFQVLLDDEDVHAALVTMRLHLKENGRAVFESRNRNIDWAAEWQGEVALEMLGTTVTESHLVYEMVDDRLKFESHYRFANRTLISNSELRFMSPSEIKDQLLAAGLSIEKLMGNWDGKPFDDKISKEMIFVTRATL